MTDLNYKLGNRIREIRKSLGMDQMKLAEIIDMEPSNLCKIECGAQIPRADNLEKIANALNVDIKDLFDFNHFCNKDDLYNLILNMINGASAKDLRLYYKLMRSCEEYNV